MNTKSFGTHQFKISNGALGIYMTLLDIFFRQNFKVEVSAPVIEMLKRDVYEKNTLFYIVVLVPPYARENVERLPDFYI